MQRALFTDEEVRLATERRLKYQGTAKVSLNQIQFEPSLPRDLDAKNLTRLREVFRKNRCRRLEVDNHVPAIVSRQHLTEALQRANVSQQSLMTTDPHRYPRLAFDVGQLHGLHGRHRVQAGSEVLPPTDRWWTVDLYMDDIGEQLRTSLVEEYANQKRPSDGEIYRKIRQYEGELNDSFRQRWFVRLSANNQERLDQLDNRRNRRLRGGFDRLLRIPGLWCGMRISMLHRLIATGCVEEILTYLGHIGDFWSSLVVDNLDAMKKIDGDTVSGLQLMAPKRSRADEKQAQGLILSGQAFAEFSEDERRAIWNRLKDFDGLIPSLYTFFEDFKYLECCAHCIKRLLSPSTESVWKTMSTMFVASPDEEAMGLVQTSESTFRRERTTGAERLDRGYRQIWLYAMRHYPLMPPDPKIEDDLLAKPTRPRADERVVHEMAELACRLGFDSPEIQAIMDRSPDHQIARAALLQARKPNRFRYSAQQFDVLVNQIVDCFNAAIPDQPETDHELLADSTVKPRARCGMPRIRTHKQDSRVLFLHYLCADEGEATGTISTFFVRRCVYFAFFGRLPPSQSCETTNSGIFPRDAPPSSPLFVEEDSPLGNHDFPWQEARQEQAQQDSPPRVQQAEGGQQTQRVQIVRRQRREQRRGRRRKAQIGRQSYSNEEGTQEPMDLEWVRPESSDQNMSDDGVSSTELPVAELNQSHHPAANDFPATWEPQNESTSQLGDYFSSPSHAAELGTDASPILDQQPSAVQPSSRGTTVEETDANSQCTRLSLKAGSLVREPDDQSIAENIRQSNDPGDRALIEYPVVASQTPESNTLGKRLADTAHGQVLQERANALAQLQSNLLFIDRPSQSSEKRVHDVTTRGAAEFTASQHIPERPAARLLEPDQVQKGTVEQQAAETSLFDVSPPPETADPVAEEFQQNDIPEGTAVASDRHRKPDQPRGFEAAQELQQVNSDLAAEEGVSPVATPVEERTQKVVTRLDFSQWAGANPVSLENENQEESILPLGQEAAPGSDQAPDQLSTSQREAGPTTPLRQENLEFAAPNGREEEGILAGHDRPADVPAPTPTQKVQLPPGHVEISFWTFERENWRQSDRLQVSHSDPSLVERVARKYTWKNYSLYDKNLQSLSPVQCYRAATVDGNNAIFLISEHEEQNLVAQGRLMNDKQLLLSVSRIVDNATDSDLERSMKRRR
ncbi:hypothetical protein BDV18DRAFT_164709 [Aspergillus unguis]